MEFAEVYLELRRGGGVQIGGDARADAHQGQIELFDWRWGLELGSQSPTGKDEDRQAEGRMVSVSKAVDRASVPMMNLLKSGELCDKAIITVKQRTDKQVLLKMVLEKVRLKSCKLKVDCGDNEVVLDEDWDMSYEKLDVHYQNMSADGGGRKTFGLTMPANSKQTEPAKLSAPNSDGTTSTSLSDEWMSKKDVLAIIEQYVKDKKIKTN